jgi:carboxypeptidase Q
MQHRFPLVRRSVRAFALPLALLATALHAQAPEPLRDDAVEWLRKQGLENSQVMEHLSWLCDVHGPRLTGSENIRRAQEWARDALASWGLQNARFEEWGPFGRSWSFDHVAVRVVGDNPWPVLAYPKAWSPGLPEGGVEAEVVYAHALSADELRTMDLSDKVVFVEPPRATSEPFDPLADRFDSDDLLTMANQIRMPAPSESEEGRRDASRFLGMQKTRAIFEVLAENPPLAIVDRYFKGDYGTVFVSRARVLTAAGEDAKSAQQTESAAMVPQLTIAVEHYNRIVRLIEKGLPVRLHLELSCTTDEKVDAMERNVIAEIPGTDPEIGDEVVMLGAHFDSWHTGTGTTDNGCGSAVMLEAMRLLSAWIAESGQKPRRTIRIGLWSGEEQGLLGSRAYVREHLAAVDGWRGPITAVHPEHATFSGYFNMDNGTGRFRGVYLQGNAAVAPIFKRWLEPFHDLDASTLTLDDTGGTDHLAFDAAGLPGFQFIQDTVAYSTRTHHSNMDVWDHAIAEDLAQNATIVASFAWHAAMRDEKLPREPMPEVVEAAANGGSGSGQ